jgi:hypothetical protein
MRYDRADGNRAPVLRSLAVLELADIALLAQGGPPPDAGSFLAPASRFTVTGAKDHRGLKSRALGISS